MNIYSKNTANRNEIQQKRKSFKINTLSSQVQIEGSKNIYSIKEKQNDIMEIQTNSNKEDLKRKDILSNFQEMNFDNEDINCKIRDSSNRLTDNIQNNNQDIKEKHLSNFVSFLTNKSDQKKVKSEKTKIKLKGIDEIDINKILKDLMIKPSEPIASIQTLLNKSKLKFHIANINVSLQNIIVNLLKKC